MKTAKISKKVKCDFCDKEGKYDGATKLGPWGYMCIADFKKYGVGLGLGIGQKLIVTK